MFHTPNTNPSQKEEDENKRQAPDEENKKLAVVAKELWQNLGEWWNKDIGTEGDPFHKELIFPTLQKLAKIKEGSFILDIGCGNGTVIRLLHRKDATFIGIDYSTALIEAANKYKEQDKMKNVHYQVVDATDSTALSALRKINNQTIKYNVIICSMVLHDLHTIKPLYEALPHLMVEGGQFICAIPSPHYNSCHNKVMEYPLKSGQHGIFTTGYRQPRAELEKAKSNQPIKHYNFHRPLGQYLNPLADQGFKFEMMEEPVVQTKALQTNPFWKVHSEIPPVTIYSFRYEPTLTAKHTSSP